MSTREHYLKLNSLTDTEVTARLPGQMLLDLDGIPSAVEPTTTTSADVWHIYVTAGELAAVGLSPADVPNLHVITEEGTDDE